MNVLKRLKLPRIDNRPIPIIDNEISFSDTALNKSSISLNETALQKDQTPESRSEKSYKKVWLRLKTKILTHIYLKKVLKNLTIMDPSKEIDFSKDNFLQDMKKKGIGFADLVTNHNKLPYGIIDPRNNFIYFWNFIMIIILSYTATISPFTLAFDEETVWGFFFDLDIAIDFFFIADLIITFNCAYFNKENQLISSRSKIFWNYLTGWFALDLFSSIPFGLIEALAFSNTHKTSSLARLSKLPKILRLSRLLKMIKNFNYLEEIDFIISINQRIIRFVRVLTGIGICLHLVSCFWYLSASIDDFSPSTWVYRYSYLDSSTWVKYLTCLYWALTTLTTIGYGDIVPYTVTEKVIAMSWMVMAVYFMSFSIGSLSSMLSQQYTKQKIINDKLILADEYKNINQISQSVAYKMKRSIRAYTDFACFSTQDRADLLDKLPITLRHEIALDMHNGAISKFPFFSVRDESFVGSIAPYLDYTSYDKHQTIWITGEPAASIYFIIKGRVEYAYGKEKVFFRSLNEGHYFGDTEIFSGKVRLFNVISRTVVNLLVMHNDLIEKIEKNFPLVWNDMQKITREREKRLFMEYAETKTMKRVGVDLETKMSGNELKEKIEEEYEKIVKSSLNKSEDTKVSEAIEDLSKEVKSHSEIIRKIESVLGINK